jgi:AraC-like DNA-binding protein
MAALGYTETECLAGSGITPKHLLATDYDELSAQQEFVVHRRLLTLSGDPLLGLAIGRYYTLETYGLLGYAFLSAQTLRQALLVASKFSLLSFTWFQLGFDVNGREATLSFTPRAAIPPDLFQYYVDRDAAAVCLAGERVLDTSFPLARVSLMHKESAFRDRYRRHFGCDIVLGSHRTEIVFDAAILELPMPMRDAEASSLCQQQCQRLLTRLNHPSGFVAEVRHLMVARPGFFPDINYVAEKLKVSTRTLRRRLAAEGSSYQQILDEMRYRLACEYLADSALTVEHISVLLGYSTPGNFSAAFKRWHGTSPQGYRFSRPKRGLVTRRQPSIARPTHR